MKTYGIALALAALGGCAAWDWDAEDKRVGHTQDAGTPTTTSQVDPVTGEAVTADSPWRADHEGRTYYFGNRESYEAFRRNPAQYVQGGAEVR